MYILVTDWEDHWDRKKSNYTSYINRMIHLPPLTDLKNETETIFIKMDRDNRILHGWKGFVRNIKRGTEKTFFSFSLLRELDVAELCRYEGMKSGWYVESSELKVNEGSRAGLLLPTLFAYLKNVDKKDFAEFEELAHIALRLLGIHRAYKFPQGNQAGEADGFFKFMNLAVIYDCTLSSNFEEVKKKQIENYCNRLLRGVVHIPPNIVEHVASHQKQVWIITNGNSRMLSSVGDVGSVIVKEVSIEDIKRLYLERLLSDSNEEELEKLLRNLGQS